MAWNPAAARGCVPTGLVRPSGHGDRPPRDAAIMRTDTLAPTHPGVRIDPEQSGRGTAGIAVFHQSRDLQGVEDTAHKALAHAVLLMAILVGVLGPVGCAAHGGSSVSLLAGPEWLFAGRDSHSGGAIGLSRERVELEGAINETLSFRVAVTARGGPRSKPILRIDAPTGGAPAIEPSWCRLFRMRRVDPGPLPGWVIRWIPPDRRIDQPLDALVPISAPRGGMPPVMLPDQEYHFWVDMHIPKGTAAGEYAGRLVLSADGVEGADVELRLTVHPFVLPDEPSVGIIAPLDHRRLIYHHIKREGRPLDLVVDDWRDDPAEQRVERLMGQVMELLRTHGLTPVLDRLRPLARIGATGALDIDWTQYDRVVGPLMDGSGFSNRRGLTALPMPVRDFALSLGDGDSSELIGEYVMQCVRHFAVQGWLDRAYIATPDASEITPASIDRVNRFARIVAPAVRAGLSPARSSSREMPHGLPEYGQTVPPGPPPPLLVSLGPQDMRPYGWSDYPRIGVADWVGTWAPPAQFYDVQAMADERSRGRATWVGVDRPPYFGTATIHARPVDTRVLSWCARHISAEVTLLPTVNRWPRGPTPAYPEDCVRVDPGVLLYPGAAFGLDGPIPSVRLKRLRQSMIDAAYVDLLNEHGLGYVAEAVGSALVSRAGSEAYRTHYADGRPPGWPDDSGRFDAARDIMVQALLRKLGDPAGARRVESLVANVSWRRFMLGTRTLNLAVEGVRVRVDRGGDSPAVTNSPTLTSSPTLTDGGLIVDYTLNVLNNRRTPLSGTIGFDSLPPGWTSSTGPVPIERLAPGSSRRVVIAARTRGVLTDAAGALTTEIKIETTEGECFSIGARLSQAIAVHTENPPTIDGSLNDWPVGIGNVMGDFVLITGAEAHPTSMAGRDARPTFAVGSRGEGRRSRPAHATTAFVLRDDEFLYLGINCAFSEDAPTNSPAVKAIRYDDLVPVGEDLIEVLIDPLGAGTRSPTDLFHVVVKRSGVDLTERGIGLSPPCGRRAPWAADLQSATRISDGRWTVELRIPIASFDRALTRGTVWGINVTRFDASREEFSTWSGAVGNAYDPLSLGNLYWP